MLQRSGKAPGLFWLGGFRSDMRGTKAEALDEWARRSGHAFLRFDYSGHGESGGSFAAGTISRWTDEAMAVLRRSHGPQILVGSSMGAWIALRLVQRLNAEGTPGRIAGLVLIAPAPDFVTELLEPKLTKRQRDDLAKKGFFEVVSQYSPEPYVYTRALFEDGRANRVLEGMIDTHCPIHILQGLADPDVPHGHALKLVEHLPADDVTLSLIRDGDHRLSRPQDLDLLVRAVETMVSATA
jgi:pimeloyl-ACP methyl ester carboxylesterase